MRQCALHRSLAAAPFNSRLRAHACARGKPTVVGGVYQNGRLLRTRPHMYADFNYSPTGHLSRHERARVRALFICTHPTVNSISPRCYGDEIFVFFSPRIRRAKKRRAHALLYVLRRRDSSIGACVRTRSLVRGHAPASLPWSLSVCPTACLVPLSLFLSCLATFLPTPSLANATWCIGVVRYDALVRRINTFAEFSYFKINSLLYNLTRFRVIII